MSYKPNNKKHYNKSNRQNHKKRATKGFQPKNERFESSEISLHDSEQPDFIYGRHAVLAALEKNQKINKLFVQEALSNPEITTILALAKQNRIQVQNVPKTKLNDLTDNAVHQGVVLSIAAFEYAELDDLFEIAEKREEQPFFMILDGIEDPFNLGSILRSADATGVHGIIIPKRRSVSLTSTVAKTSTGAIEHVPVVRVTNITQTIDELKKRGVWIFGTDMNGTDYRRWKTDCPLAVVIGNEGKGISRLVKDSVDEMVTIPMTGHVQSLNAGVASALMMYEVYRGRHNL
ncbi:23S rRNA (guanosine2251-2'-O)-methyltransferase [Granulicatella balaenopterae]|uniref:23S rRNA (Guanosine2251-2'-O)-methyltransferase n=1 Tax=Granulicatella balaenopterae TaxID=137733 RepID=A0A1H9PER1_9LACT|nr:23S rRNA (guanosine(2251)-2'-O)-methyltransferase RlmB [Granulicatella balaenopterae]SER46746.1 23S rRNA (guanosine2251-2'-O)-methyltransferase [Granulicatella balaenopterae]